MPDKIDAAVETRRRRHRDLLWLTLGWAALALGAIGIFLPVLPTTPFVILAAFAFGKGSPRLRHWLVSHARFGPMIHDWETYGAIARPYKIIACTVMALTFTVSLVVGLAWWILAIQATCMIPAGIYVVTRPDGPKG